MGFSVDQSVREIAIENPATVSIFESLGIDYCCGGAKPLRVACEHAKVPLARAVELLASANPDVADADDTRWKDSALADLATHIVEQHHAFVRREAPRLETLAGKVAEKHGERHPETPQIRDVFTAIAQELFAHMMKEENLLFPYLSQMESAVLAGEPVPPAFFGSVQNPIARMLAEHDDAAELLSQMRKLSNGFQPPEDASPSYHGLYHGLEEFERDLHRHIHLENNILFPRAVNLERGRDSGA
jgi:regulator of cell morphogenesis and NO signaling